eukprot:3550805-Alexandrium_andersonii.AAC.1
MDVRHRAGCLQTVELAQVELRDVLRQRSSISPLVVAEKGLDLGTLLVVQHAGVFTQGARL